MALREKITQAMLGYRPIPAEKAFDSKHPYHYKTYTDNLFSSMGDQALQAYGNGSGGEMIATERSPAKMASIVSSSAMTYNLLGDGPVEIVWEDCLPKDIAIRNTDDPDHVVVSLWASPNAMEHWALQYLNHVEVVAPAHLRKRIQENLQNGLQKYHSK